MRSAPGEPIALEFLSTERSSSAGEQKSRPAWGKLALFVAVVALLHDFDYERYPTLGDHPYYAHLLVYIAEIDAHGSAWSDEAPPLS